ncbi:timeless protein-domain-containing protein [Lipomyces kononenkoae]|uniref:Timeless protein-domain-containing protein n=1 Tax=Lipomyces kononenkoae TaxID=34357 RepID=A0ACC3T8R9_LIPKO
MEIESSPYDQPEVIDVDPTVHAHITSLVSALGGPDHSLPDQRYVLGDDALACLKDLKRWLKAYDEKLNRLDVARIIAKTSLVTDDILQILTEWEASRAGCTMNEFRIALACVELLVPLTWPIRLEGLRNTMETNKHKPHIEQAQRSYKLSIINHPTKKVLQAVACIALPSISLTHRERTPRDEGIIRLVLYFFRNIAMIETVADSILDEGRTAVILAFAQQSIFDLINALGSGVSDLLKGIDLQLLELVFHMVKGIDPDTLHCNSSESFINKQTRSSWLRLENGSESKSRATATRHNRFDTMTSLVVADKTRLTVSGQRALEGSGSAMDKLDGLKMWRRPAGGFRRTNDDLVKPTLISGDAQKALAIFVDEFLGSAFNPLCISIRKEIERESDRVEDHHEEQFLYLVFWFLSAELARQRSTPNTSHGFALVAGMLDQQSLVTITKLLRTAVESRHMRKLGYAMHCFKQIIMLTSAMSGNDDETNKEIADNMISRLFYEETTLDLLASLPNVLHGASISLMTACCDLLYVVLKVLEAYSNHDARLYIRGKRKRSRKQKLSNSPRVGIHDKGYTVQSSDEDDNIARQQSKERSFEFSRFERKFFTQNCIDMFRSVLATYDDLSDQQIKRIISFFHRIFFKREEEVLLYRLDFMLVLRRCLDPREGISLSNSARKEVELFMRHYVRKLAKALEERPALYVELSFTKMPDTLFFLKYGHDEEKQLKRKREKTVPVDNTGDSGSDVNDGHDAMGITDDKSDSDVVEGTNDGGDTSDVDGDADEGDKRKRWGKTARMSSSKKSKKRSQKPRAKTDDQSPPPKRPKPSKLYLSKEYITDSDVDDDEVGVLPPDSEMVVEHGEMDGAFARGTMRGDIGDHTDRSENGRDADDGDSNIGYGLDDSDNNSSESDSSSRIGT